MKENKFSIKNSHTFQIIKLSEHLRRNNFSDILSSYKLVDGPLAGRWFMHETSTHNIDPFLAEFGSSVVDGGPTLNQYWGYILFAGKPYSRSVVNALI